MRRGVLGAHGDDDGGAAKGYRSGAGAAGGEGAEGGGWRSWVLSRVWGWAMLILLEYRKAGCRLARETGQRRRTALRLYLFGSEKING